MKISIIGFGFVGKAIANALKGSFELQKIDPILKTTTEELKDFKPNIIFICVPTPMKKDGKQDIEILRNIIERISSYNLNSLVVVKSTILPTYVSELENVLPNFVYNPEFLREKHAEEDFINSKIIVFGGKEESTHMLAKFYDDYLMCKCEDYIFTDTITASFTKYIINSFLATKVIFFNEFYQLFKLSNSKESWSNLIEILTKDERIGSSHMDVPGHDGRFGFGGACLPKDSKAILNYSETLGKDLAVLKTAIKINNKIRASYNKNTKREDEQNIFFEDID
tara:strand:+ start:782 stop:1627 length:846 start_codon:yes stop_codon:yes gene_type:complete